MRILLIEDEPEIARLMAAQIMRHGFVVDGVRSLSEAEAAVSVARYALILLDRRLPDGEGLDLLRPLRRAQRGVPIIVLTALDTVQDKVNGLDAGADDYLTKPVDVDELMARIRATLRRGGGEAPPPVTCGALMFDPSTREVTVRAESMLLKRRELILLECLMLRARRVVQRETLLSEMYGFDDDIQSNTLDAHVSRLRTRLAEAGAGVTIFPVRGVGYLLDEVPSCA